MKVKMNKHHVHIKYAQIEPDEEQIEQAKDNLTYALLIRRRDDLLQERQAKNEIRLRTMGKQAFTFQMIGDKRPLVVRVEWISILPILNGKELLKEILVHFQTERFFLQWKLQRPQIVFVALQRSQLLLDITGALLLSGRKMPADPAEAIFVLVHRRLMGD